MKRRMILHEILCGILGSRNVYFQPPESLQMKYPAIVYSRDGRKNLFADNVPYQGMYLYKVTVIDKDPESEFVEKMTKLPLCRFIQHFTADNLNHDVFLLYF